MTKNEFLDIVNKEGLKNYNLYNENNLKPDELVITKENHNWIVYATSERASYVTGSEVTFDNESSALENLIERLRADKLLASL